MIYTHAIVALVAAVLAAAGAWQVQSWRYEAKEAARLEMEREAIRSNAKISDKASETHEQAKVEIRTEFQTITKEVEKIVEKPVYRNVCFDADGMRLLSQAIGRRPPTGEPAPALPGPEHAD